MKIGVGSVVLSTAGRDKGRYYIVVEIISEDYVKISDGNLRPQEKAKLKKSKHLKPNGDFLSKIAEKLTTKKQVFDAEIRSALRVYNDNNKEEQ
ncbi:MAG: KOW domain-containing RNA-binding protein [Clostridia bacterium]